MYFCSVTSSAFSRTSTASSPSWLRTIQNTWTFSPDVLGCQWDIGGLLQDCGISSALAMGFLQSGTKPSIEFVEKKRMVMSSTLSSMLTSGGCHGPLTRYIKLQVAHAPGMPGTFSSPPRICVTHVQWCMPGSLTSGFLWSRGRENVPGIPGPCAIHNFTYLARSSLWLHTLPSVTTELSCYILKQEALRKVMYWNDTSLRAHT